MKCRIFGTHFSISIYDPALAASTSGRLMQMVGKKLFAVGLVADNLKPPRLDMPTRCCTDQERTRRTGKSSDQGQYPPHISLPSALPISPFSSLSPASCLFFVSLPLSDRRPFERFVVLWRLRCEFLKIKLNSSLRSCLPNLPHRRRIVKKKIGDKIHFSCLMQSLFHPRSSASVPLPTVSDI